jgi:type III pantothenate kinase
MSASDDERRRSGGGNAPRGRAPRRAARQSSGARRAPSALLVDIGNTRIKWARWHAGRLGRPRAEVYTDWSSEDFARRVLRQEKRTRAQAPARIIVASVADPRVFGRLAAGARRASRTGASVSPLRRAKTAAPELIATSRRAGGVVTRYREPWRLGVDRFLGAIAAHHLAGSRSAFVVNVGTAVTLDLVDGRGVHRGGAILPGSQLMIESLLRGTAGIARRARGSSQSAASIPAREARRAASRARNRSTSGFARDTATAIEQGAAYAVAGAVEHAIASSRRELGGSAPLVILTGGGAAKLRRLLRVRCIEVPDLVLRGIALHAGLALR